jgi:hypothetical protein
MTIDRPRNSATATSGAADRPRTAGAFTPRITPAQRRALLAGARDPIGLLPKSVNLRTLASLADIGYVGLDQSRDVLRGQEATRDALDVWGGALTEDGWQRARAEGAGRFRIVVVSGGRAGSHGAPRRGERARQQVRATASP